VEKGVFVLNDELAISSCKTSPEGDFKIPSWHLIGDINPSKSAQMYQSHPDAPTSRNFSRISKRIFQ